jgi:hypothetical protein
VSDCEWCRDLEDGRRCQACVLDAHDDRVERDTIARVVAWLRARADERHGSAGQLWSADIANRLERGDWKEKSEPAAPAVEDDEAIVDRLVGAATAKLGTRTLREPSARLSSWTCSVCRVRVHAGVQHPGCDGARKPGGS